MPADNLRASLDTLGKLSKQLNRITDDANETVRLVEQFLDDCSIGLNASIYCDTLDTVNELDETNTVFLEYERYSSTGKFRICVTVRDFEDDVQFYNPWSDCSRELKLDTFPYLPALLDTLAGQAQTVIEMNEIRTNAIIKAVQGVISPRVKKTTTIADI